MFVPHEKRCNVVGLWDPPTVKLGQLGDADMDLLVFSGAHGHSAS